MEFLQQTSPRSITIPIETSSIHQSPNPQPYNQYHEERRRPTARQKGQTQLSPATKKEKKRATKTGCSLGTFLPQEGKLHSVVTEVTSDGRRGAYWVWQAESKSARKSSLLSCLGRSACRDEALFSLLSPCPVFVERFCRRECPVECSC